MSRIGELLLGESDGLRFVDRGRPAFLAFAGLFILGLGATYFGDRVRRLLKNWKYGTYVGPAVWIASLVPLGNGLRIYLFPPKPPYDASAHLSPLAATQAQREGLPNSLGSNLCFLNTALQRMAKTNLWTAVLNERPEGETSEMRELRGRLRSVVAKLREGKTVFESEVVAIRGLLSRTSVVRDSTGGVRQNAGRVVCWRQHDSAEVLQQLLEHLGDRQYPKMQIRSTFTDGRPAHEEESCCFDGYVGDHGDQEAVTTRQLFDGTEERVRFKERPPLIEVKVVHSVAASGARADNDRPFRPDLELNVDELLVNPTGEALTYELVDVICNRSRSYGTEGHYWYIHRDPDHPEQFILYNDADVSVLNQEQFFTLVKHSGVSFLYLPKDSEPASSTGPEGEQ